MPLIADRVASKLLPTVGACINEAENKWGMLSHWQSPARRTGIWLIRHLRVILIALPVIFFGWNVLAGGIAVLRGEQHTGQQQRVSAPAPAFRPASPGQRH